MTVTPTASGKTLCYNVPVLSAILAEPSSRALYLFPTKALAQDQLAELDGLAEGLRAGGDEVGAYTYDGDTPQDARRAIRSRAQIVLSNPDMLHAGILPHHPRWAKLFENLRYVVIDELHAYRGVFGSHLANILRRLARVCRHYGSAPTFICSSATIANPKSLAESLTGEPFALVDQSGAPQGEKWFVMVNLKRPRFSWTRIKGESNVQGGGGNGSVEGRGTGRGIGADGGSPAGDWSPCRRGGGRGGRPGAGAAVERQPEARRGAAATAWRIAGGAVP